MVEIYLIMGLLFILIILVMVLIFRKDNKLSENMKVNNSNNNLELIRNINALLIQNMEMINNKISANDNKQQEVMISLVEKLAKIDEAQKHINDLKTNINGLENILSDKKTRGIYGEVSLYQILESIFGQNNILFEKQKKLSNGFITDAILHVPSPIGDIAIDSKFPLENYQRLMEDEDVIKEFRSDIKRHIDAIKSKYIIAGETSMQAIMFIPAEGVFSYINAHMSDIIIYAQKNRIWITSPTTLIATLTTIQVIAQNIERDKYADIIQKELEKLSVEFIRFHDRWKRQASLIEALGKNTNELTITAEKIENRFEQIANVDVDKEEKKTYN